jgi:hypothetical protein
MASRVPGTHRSPTRLTIGALASATVWELAARGVPIAGSCTIASWLGQLVLRKAGIVATPISVVCTVSLNGRYIRSAADESSFAGGHMILLTEQPARLLDLSFGQFTGLPGLTVPAYLDVPLGDPEAWPKAFRLPTGGTVTYSNPTALPAEEQAEGNGLARLLDGWAATAMNRSGDEFSGHAAPLTKTKENQPMSSTKKPTTPPSNTPKVTHDWTTIEVIDAHGRRGLEGKPVPPKAGQYGS